MADQAQQPLVFDAGGMQRRASDGALIASAKVARTGIQLYRARDFAAFKDRPPDEVVRVYRSEDQVFDPDSLASYTHKTVTNDHPSGGVMVGPENAKDLSVGMTGESWARHGDYALVPLLVSDGATIADIEAGKVELSAGYTCTLDTSPGVTPTGEAFDASMADIRVNHVAIVHRGRAGSEARILDAGPKWGAAPLVDEGKGDPMPVQTKTITYDGLPVETTDAAEAVINKLSVAVGDAKAEAAKAKADAAAAIDAKDKELGALKAELQAAKDAAMTPEKMADAIAARVELEGKAKAVDADVVTAGVSDADLRKAVVTKALGEDTVTGASDAQIEGMFTAVTAQKRADPVRDNLMKPRLAQVGDGWDRAAEISGVKMKKEA